LAKAEARRLADHLSELRTRVFWAALVLTIGTVVGFIIHERLFAILQRPYGSELYYTSPTGSFNFIIKLAIGFGAVLATPVAVYQVLRFVDPVTKLGLKTTLKASFASIALAIGGASFAYFVSLPAAIHFLTNFGGDLIQPLISADEYFSFAAAYVFGFALLFQLPIVFAIINKVKPLKPSKMMKYQRHLIVGSAIVAAILTPTPDPINQMIMAVPIIILYQFTIFYIMFTNWRSRPRARKATVVQATPNPQQPQVRSVAPDHPSIRSVGQLALEAVQI